VDAARECGFAAISANDHFMLPPPWLDGPTAVAAAAGRPGPMTLVTTLALPALRRPVPLAKALCALDILSGGRVTADLGPGLSHGRLPGVRRGPAELRGRVCVGSAPECAELPSCYARASCRRVHFWPVGDERRQVELIAGEVMPRVSCRPPVS
jgi:hypothetical protein